MQLFWMEMKKIFSWKIISLIVFVNVVLYFLLFDFDIKYFPNGRPNLDHFRIEQQVIPKYGADIDEQEYADFIEQYERKVEDANTYLQNDPQAVALEIMSYESFKNVEINTQKQMDYRNLVLLERNEDLFWELQAMEYHIEQSYKNRIISLQSQIEEATATQQKHFEEMLRDEKYSFYTSVVLENFKKIKTNMTIILFISIAILVSPIFLRDKLITMEPLQYSSKKGRGVYKIKWLAGLVSTVLLTILLLVFYLSIYTTNHTSSHFDLSLYAMDNLYSWYDITFGQYIILSVSVIILVALLLGILSMTISVVVSNTIGLIGMQIVTIFIMIAGVAIFLIGEIVSVWYPIWFVPLGYSLFFGVIIALILTIRKREMQRDIL